MPRVRLRSPHVESQRLPNGRLGMGSGGPETCCTTLYRASISNSIQYTLLLVSNTTLVHWPCTVLGYTGRLAIQ